MKTFGWKATKCDSCGHLINHPAMKSKGGRHDRGVENESQLSLVLPSNCYEKIKKLASQMGTTKGAITRSLIKIGLDETQ
jgi:hypothetical protein